MNEEQLRALNRTLETEKERLQHEAAQLQAQTAELQAENLRVVKLNEGLEAQLKSTLEELAELKRQLFGEKSDQLTPEEEGQLAEVADCNGARKKVGSESDEIVEGCAVNAGWDVEGISGCPWGWFRGWSGSGRDVGSLPGVCGRASRGSLPEVPWVAFPGFESGRASGAGHG